MATTYTDYAIEPTLYVGNSAVSSGQPYSLGQESAVAAQILLTGLETLLIMDILFKSISIMQGQVVVRNSTLT